MNTLHETIQNIVEKARSKMGPDRWKERIVLDHLYACYLLNKPQTQKMIARACPTLGPHIKELEHEVVDETKIESTVRQVRQVTFNLRIIFRLPIISGHRGYWFPWNMQEVQAFLGRMEREASKRAESSLKTYEVLEETLGAKSKLFAVLKTLPGAEEQQKFDL